MSRIKHCRLNWQVDLNPHLEDRALISVEVRPGQELLALGISGVVDYRADSASGASFARLRTNQPHDFTILRYQGGEFSRVEIRNEYWNFHYVQPLPDDELLLVCARCRHYPDGTQDSNAHVYDASGRLRREFVLGDGIERVQTTSDGRIWVSYFDEGVFGNLGWLEPIGASGLTYWDAKGRLLYSYAPPAETDSICDCYAMNVVSDEETWIYYYTEFPLIRIYRAGETTVWPCPLADSDSFAVYQDHVLFRGGYNRRDTYHLFQLGLDGTMTPQATFRFTDHSDRALKSCAALARGPLLYLVKDACCFRIDVRELV